MTNIYTEYIKCLKDKTRQYFIEKYLSTFNADERKEVPFKLFPRQIAFLNSLVDNSNTIAIKHRQAGITTVSSAWITGQIVFASEKSPETILCIGNKLDISEQLVEKIGNFLDQVPRWMWGPNFYSPDPDNEKNKKSIYKARNKQRIELFNGCKVYARSSGEHAARGISAVSILIFDEAAFIQNGIAVYAQAVAATASVSNAKIIMVSTPNGKDQLYYKTYSKALLKENNYFAVEFKWFQDLRYNRYLKWYKKNADTGEIEWNNDTVIGKRGEIEYNEERWRKLEKEGWTPTSPWYEDMCKSFNNDEQKIAQELNVSFLGSSDNVVPIEAIEMQRTENVIEITDDWPLKDKFIKETWIWKDPIPNHRYICACIPEGETVVTNEGIKNIENVNKYDKLLNNNGHFIPIKHRKYRNVIDEKIIKVKLHNILDSTSFTWNHPIWSSIDSKLLCKSKITNKVRKRWYEYHHDFKYNFSENLKNGDWLEFPNYYYINEITEDELKNYWNKYDSIECHTNKILNNPLLSEDFWWYCGIWLAEGFCNKNRLETCHNINENEYVEHIIKLSKNLFGRKAQKYVREQMNSVNVYFSSKQLSKFIIDNFGKMSYNKNITEWIKFIPRKFKLKLIEGYLDGDGCYGNEIIDACSVSKKLINDLQDLLLSCGYIANVNKLRNETEGYFFKKNIKTKKRTCFRLRLTQYYTNKFYKEVKEKTSLKNVKLSKQHMYFTNDEKYICVKIQKVEESLYTGKVFNFETDDINHSFGCRYIMTHNCDPSSGSGEDKTAIEIIDVDAVDENGYPCIEQVLEYNGKMTGDEIGEMIYRYASVYNNALVVVECIGGYGDATVLSLISLKYPNIYYDDPHLKKYTSQLAHSKLGISQNEKLPGFRTNNMRIQMISNFVSMIKDNSFRIRSIRVINELETWIFKNGRPDHMDSANDDTLTCLSMGLFVMTYSMLKTEKQKQKDSYIVKSWFVNNQNYVDNKLKNIDVSQQNTFTKNFNPFTMTDKKQQERQMKACMMLMGFFIKKQ